MESNEILEGNKLIAEFMGLEVKRHFKNPDHWVYLKNIDNDGNKHYSLIADLKYNTSWDQLMPVVEKIERLEYTVTIMETSCIIKADTQPVYYRFQMNTTKSTKIEATYTAIINFINHYNQKK